MRRNIKNDSCPFCADDIKEISFLENDFFYAIYNVSPILPGHSLIIPKNHIVSLFELDADELQQFMLLGQQAGLVLSKAFDTTSFNWSIQEKPPAGQSVPHLHMHVIPRKINDLPEPGDWYPQLEEKYYSNHIDSKERSKFSRAELIQIVKKLRAFSLK